MIPDLSSALTRELPAARALRRRLHTAPDVSGDEAATRDAVLAALPAGARPVPVADTGAIVRIGGPGPAVGVRAELDALRVTEATGVAWSSRRCGVMHACGHDVHLAAAVALARAVHHLDAPGLLLVLQPREESYPSGARDIVESCVLPTQHCAAMIGAHVQPLLTADVVACVPGSVNASADEFELLVTGESGHAAYPHRTRDPVYALAQIIVALQGIVSRELDPMSPAVIGVSTLRAGAEANIVPGTARASGTIRTFSDRTRTLLHQRVTDVAEGVAHVHGCTAKISITRGEPVLRNDPALATRVTDQLQRRGFEVCDTLRSAGADDFSYYGQQLPSLMLFVGTDTDVPLHNEAFLPTDDDLTRVAHTLLAAYQGASNYLASR